MPNFSEDLEYLKKNPDKVTSFIQAAVSENNRSPEHMFGLASALYSDETKQVKFVRGYLVAYKIFDVIQHKESHGTLDDYRKAPESEADIKLKDATIRFIRNLKSPDNILPMLEDLVIKFKPSREEVLDLFLDKFVELSPRTKQKELVVTKDFANYLKETIPQDGDTKPHFLDQVLFQFFIDEFLNKSKDAIDSADTEKSQETDITKVTPNSFVTSLLNYISNRPATTRNVIISYLKECEKTDKEITTVLNDKSPESQEANKKTATLFLLTPLLDRVDGMRKAVEEVLNVQQDALLDLQVPIGRVSLARVSSLQDVLDDKLHPNGNGHDHSSGGARST